MTAWRTPPGFLPIVAATTALAACSLVFRYNETVATGAGGGAASASAGPGGMGGNAAMSSSTGPLMCSGKTPDKCGETCVDLKGDLHNCAECGMECQGTRVCKGGLCIKPESCRQLKTARPTTPSGIYELDPDGADSGAPPFQTYCEMVADDGGWTLLMKVAANGVFPYAGLWEASVPYRADKPDLDQQEAKLQSCFTVPFTELRVGMRAFNEVVTRWIVVPFASTSLCALFKAKIPVLTAYGVDKWRSLFAAPATAQNVCYEGVNLGYVRFGITTATDCTKGPDAIIGFGTELNWKLSESTGDIVKCCVPPNTGNTPAFGYLMAR